MLHVFVSLEMKLKFFRVFLSPSLFYWVGRGWRKSYNQHSTQKKTEPSKKSTIYIHIDSRTQSRSECVSLIIMHVLRVIKMRVNQFSFIEEKDVYKMYVLRLSCYECFHSG